MNTIGTSTITKGTLRKEEQGLIDDLQEQINRYKNTIQVLSDKNKALTDQLDKKKKEADMLKRSLQRIKPPSITPSFHKQNTSEMSLEIVPAPRAMSSSSKRGLGGLGVKESESHGDSRLVEIAQETKKKYVIV